MQNQWREVEIQADGARLAARIYETATPPKGVALIHPATGAPQKIYRAFAQWVVEQQGVTVVTYDYRDFAASAPLGVPLRASTADKHAWGVLDQSAAVDFAAGLAGGDNLTVIGHSLGGMTTPLHPNADKISRMIVVASGPAYWSHHPFPYVLFVMLFWFVIGPLATWGLGYTPGRRLGLGADLPAGVFWQWRRWCLTRGFYRPDVGVKLPATDFRNMKARLKLVSLTDDVMIPPKFVAGLADFYKAAEVSHLILSPQDGGGGTIGHFGAFLPHHKAIWPKIMA
ncbi:MAG: alpha/beta fold hydrolase [Pikeienuella sp.]